MLFHLPPLVPIRSRMSEESQITILQPVGYSSSSCGYCPDANGQKRKTKSSKSYGVWAHSLSPTIYSQLLPLGWRRSGSYLYKPDQRATCCPQYTISLRADQFQSTKSQRGVLKVFANYVMHGVGEKEGTKGWGMEKSSSVASVARETRGAVVSDTVENEGVGKGVAGAASTSRLEPSKGGNRNDGSSKKGKGKQKSLSEAIHEPEWINSPADKPFAHKFQVGPTFSLSNNADHRGFIVFSRASIVHGREIRPLLALSDRNAPSSSRRNHSKRIHAIPRRFTNGDRAHPLCSDALVRLSSFTLSHRWETGSALRNRYSAWSDFVGICDYGS